MTIFVKVNSSVKKLRMYNEFYKKYNGGIYKLKCIILRTERVMEIQALYFLGLGQGIADHALLQALPVAVYTTDEDGRITFYNEAAARLWGCRPVESQAGRAGERPS